MKQRRPSAKTSHPFRRIDLSVGRRFVRDNCRTSSLTLLTSAARPFTTATTINVYATHFDRP